MQITGRSGAGYHPNTRVKLGHTSSMSRMSWNEVRTVLFSPLTFHINVSGDYGVGLIVHAGKMREEKAVGKAKSE